MPLGNVGAALAVVGDGDAQPVAVADCTETTAWVAPLCLAMLVNASAMVK